MGVSHTGPVFQGPAFEATSPGDPAVVSGHRISARLGTGARGRVYFAHAPGGQPVALTVIRAELAEQPDFAARFHRDAQGAGRVRGPFTVPVTGSGKEGDRYWIASAYVPSVSLHAAVRGAGPLPTGVVLRLVAGIAEGLRTIHHAGVVHGDLRPAHILLAADGPRIKDYGIARTSDTALLTGTAAANGAPVFLAPEQAAGKPSVPATDVFALGQLAAYASIGTAPFGDGPAHTVLPRVQQEEPDLSELPGELREIVTRCLIKAPALRPSPAQIIAMCAQASPDATRPRPDPWLPPALLAALVPALPRTAPGGTGPGGTGPAPGAVPGPRSAVGAERMPDAGQVSGGGTGAGGGPGGAPVVGSGPGSGFRAEGGSAPAYPPGAGHGVVPGVPPMPEVGPWPGVGGGPVGGPSHAPGFPWRPQTWPRPPHLHVPLPSVRRRGGGRVGLVAGLAVVVAAGIALAGGFDGDGRVESAGRGGVLPSAATATGPDDGRGAVPAPTDPPTAGAPERPTGEPTDRSTGGAAAPGTGGGDATGEPEPAAGPVYRGVEIPAGYGVSYGPDTLAVRPGALGGAFGYTDGADAFVTDPDRGSLALLDPEQPGTLAGCRGGTGQVSSVPRRVLSDGSRLCVRSRDGSTALVTYRQLTPPGAPDAYVTVDITVWPVPERGAENDQ